jgi:hypothetical protein
MNENRKSKPRLAATALLGAVAIVIALGIAGCASQQGNPDVVFEDSGAPQSVGPVNATVQINYAKKSDTLAKATVTKYFGAQVLTTERTRSGKQATVVRFNGGVPIWQIRADHTLTASIPGLGRADFAPKSVKYGTMPNHFAQVIPDEKVPEPLTRGGFYVFSIKRASGASNWEAVKVLGDGSLQGYAAEPRAGSSFVLCCDVSPDFTQPVVTSQDIMDMGNPDADMNGAN